MITGTVPSYPAAPAGYPTAQAGYQAAPPGYQAAPPGYQAAPPGYQAAPPGYPVAYQVQKTSGLAIASLVCSLAGLLFGLLSILGIIFGFAARSQIRRTGEAGEGMAVAGIIIGCISVVLWGVVIAFIVVVAHRIGSDCTNYNGTFQCGNG